MDKYSLIRSVFEINEADESVITSLAGCFSEARFAAGTVIFRENLPADSFFVVGSGEIAITRELGPGRKKLLSVFTAGTMLGEMALVADARRTATATARTDATLWKIDRADFLTFISRSPAAGVKILSGLLNVVMGRLERTSRELATLYQTGRIISAGKSIDAVIQGVQEELLLALPEADLAASYLYNPFNEEYDPSAAPAGAEPLPPNNNLIARMNETLAGFIVNTLPVPGAREIPFLAGARSLLVMPIVRGSAIHGFVLLWNTRAPGVFNNNHLLLASSVSVQLAEAIENLRHAQEDRDRRRLNEARQDY